MESQGCQNGGKLALPPVYGTFFRITLRHRGSRVFLLLKNLFYLVSSIVLVRKHIGP